MRVTSSIPDYLNLNPGQNGPAARSAAGKSPLKTAIDGCETPVPQAGLVLQAMAADEIRTDAVEQARQLLKSGQLDSPDAVRKAAQAMLDLGL